MVSSKLVLISMEVVSYIYIAKFSLNSSKMNQYVDLLLISFRSDTCYGNAICKDICGLIRWYLLRNIKFKFYKLLPHDCVLHGFVFREGLNIDPMPVGDGHLYFTPAPHLWKWIDNDHPLIADVIIPDDVLVCVEPCATKWRANCIILENIRPLRDEATKNQ